MGNRLVRTSLVMASVVGLLTGALLYQAEFARHVPCSGPTLNEAVALNGTWHTRALIALAAGGLGLGCCGAAIPSARPLARFWLILLGAGFVGAMWLFWVIASVTSQPCYT
jgi:hypothetical protein